VQVFIELKIPQPACGRWHCTTEGSLGCKAESCNLEEDALATNLEYPQSLYSESNKTNHEGEATVSLWSAAASKPAFDKVRLDNNLLAWCLPARLLQSSAQLCCDQDQAQSASPLKSSNDVIDILCTFSDVELKTVREHIDALIARRLSCAGQTVGQGEAACHATSLEVGIDRRTTLPGCG
jgi:hypothetical protein